MRQILIALTFLMALPSRVHPGEVDFVRDVRPILQRRCYACHGSTTRKGSLRLDIRSEAFKGGESWGPSIVAGDAAASPLIELVTSPDESLRMPLGKEPLSDEEVQTLNRWIDAGAEWPDGTDLALPVNKLDHWSFRPIAIDGHHASVDQWIDAMLAERGLERNPPAESQDLVRRIFLDLTGLPPQPSEVAVFVKDPNVPRLVDRLLASPRYGERWAQHWMDVIRWAETVGFETNAERTDAWPYRDWVIRALNEDKPYDQFMFEQIAGDTVGADAALGFLVAGPANLPGQIGRDEAAMRGARQDELDEVIRTVSQAFLGLTIGCARCHDHKFDPISQRDYYSMQAIFAGLRYGTRRLRGEENDAWTAEVPTVRKEVSALRERLDALRDKHGLRPSIREIHSESFSPVVAESIRMKIFATQDGGPASLYEFEVWTADEGESSPAINVALASRKATPTASSFALANQSRHFDNLLDGSVDERQSYPWVAAVRGPAWLRVDFHQPATIDRIVMHRGSSVPVDYVVDVRAPGSREWREVVHSRDRLPRVDDLRPVESVRLTNLSSSETQQLFELLAKLREAEQRLARLAAGPQVYAANFDPRPATTYLLHRGDAMQRREVAAPAIPEFLGRLRIAPDAPEAERRIALARHLTRPDHLLSARVMVNRVWQHHFGSGLVATPSDFGRMGAAPSHPQLLDWLAARFVADGWSLKKLHRRILTSETYCQSSEPRQNALAIDAESRMLWRFPPRRLEAEAIRDSMLAVSGHLNLQMGGPGFDFFNQRGGLSDYIPKQTFQSDGWRRMIYAHKVRMVSVDVFGQFDCPDAGQMKPIRTRSITPIQSLGLFNSPFSFRQAMYFAERLRAQIGDDTNQQVELAFQLAFSRSPTTEERSRLAELAVQHGLEQVCRVIFNTSEFAFLR